MQSECMPWRTLARVQLSPSSALIMTPWPIVLTRMVPLFTMAHLRTSSEPFCVRAPATIRLSARLRDCVDSRSASASPWLTKRTLQRLEPERLELGWGQHDTRDGVDSAPRQILPGQFDLRQRNTSLPPAVADRAAPLSLALAPAKPASPP